MNVTALLNGPLGDTLGWTLIHLLWQATAVALILGAIRTLWRSASSDARYLTAIAALATVLLLPALTFSHLWDQRSIGPVPNVIESGADSSWMATTSSDYRVDFAAAPTGVESIVSASLPWLVGFWLVGVTLLAGRLMIRTAWTSRLTRTQVIEVEGSWKRVVQRLRGKLGIGRAIAIYESALVEVPTVVGWLKPVILVPTSVFTGLTYRQIETILAHELAHVRRFDALVNFIQSMVETLFFFHPAVWWISGRIRIEREHCCDDVAIAVCGDRVAYARALTFLEESRAEVPIGAVAATGGSLLQRIRRIAGVEERDRKAPSIAALAVLLLLSGATAWALTSPASEAEPDAEVIVEESGWWYVSPPLPPAPPAPPAVPAVAPWSVEPPPMPEPPLAPAPPTAPEEPSWIVETAAALALFDLDVPLPELPDPPAPPAPPSAPRISLVAPSAPAAPTAPRIASVAPRPNAKYEVRAGSGGKVEDDRNISDELTVDDLIRLRSVGVTTDYIQALKSSGYGDLTISEVVALRGVGVTPDYIRTMKQNFGADLSVRDLIQLRGVGVSPEWLASMESLSSKLDVRRAIQLRGVGVTSEWIDEMSRALGESLSIDDAVRLRGVGVSHDYLRELRSRGITAPPVSDLIRLRGVGVTAEYIDAMRKAGLGEIDTDRLIQLRGVGVTPEYVELLRKAGYASKDAQTLVRLRGVGVTPEYVNELRDAGIGVNDVDDLIRLRGVGVTPEYVRELREAGLKNLTVDKLIRLRGAGVDADYIREMTE